MWLTSSLTISIHELYPFNGTVVVSNNARVTTLSIKQIAWVFIVGISTSLHHHALIEAQQLIAPFHSERLYTAYVSMARLTSNTGILHIDSSHCFLTLHSTEVKQQFLLLIHWLITMVFFILTSLIIIHEIHVAYKQIKFKGFPSVFKSDVLVPEINEIVNSRKQRRLTLLYKLII